MASAPLTVREYLRLLARDPLVPAGLVLFVLGVVVVDLTPGLGSLVTGRIGAFALSAGVIVFGLGYTRVQHVLRDRRER
ncbi:hypothetical protein MBEHAL_1313 [Halarchaeum acidiphilum MH1-52-1]|uniref:DUF1538 domain-containing protein n=1 Tax=Halarchaeum acidiphilum MH1-52-1 TaxID=1261545 RepID=U3ACQ3_9EURY|nr:hypothetical protein [Halarchaeum acidiphilum]GAD52553.1 hypothetical protein MBEHAL_1313 [Halarchaeum acidiphilum MH1-52-1]